MIRFQVFKMNLRDFYNVCIIFHNQVEFSKMFVLFDLYYMFEQNIEFSSGVFQNLLFFFSF